MKRIISASFKFACCCNIEATRVHTAHMCTYVRMYACMYAYIYVPGDMLSLMGRRRRTAVAWRSALCAVLLVHSLSFSAIAIDGSMLLRRSGVVGCPSCGTCL